MPYEMKRKHGKNDKIRTLSKKWSLFLLTSCLSTVPLQSHAADGRRDHSSPENNIDLVALPTRQYHLPSLFDALIAPAEAATTGPAVVTCPSISYIQYSLVPIDNNGTFSTPVYGQCLDSSTLAKVDGVPAIATIVSSDNVATPALYTFGIDPATGNQVLTLYPPPPPNMSVTFGV